VVFINASAFSRSAGSVNEGRGLATMAAREAVQFVFQMTAVERVLGITDARNRASIGVLERVGMRKLEERSTVFRGESCVECVYAKVRNDGQFQNPRGFNLLHR
jgi:RimJ/RimL family protein N-acetyltransferase